MTPLDFLEMVWPDAGHYALATPFTPKGSTTSVYAHKVFSSFTDAAVYVERNKTKLDLFFCVHSLKSPKLWNPNKLDLRTGEKGAFEVRTQRNTLQAKAFFFDLDVGEGLKKYTTRKEALGGLIRFCRETQLPKPLITSSGRGMHVYWVLDEALDSDTWRTHASKLRQLAQHHGLKVDPARTTDTASVLRVAGTFNFKNREAPKPVEVVSIGAPTPTVAFVKLLDSAIIRAGVTAKPTAAPQPALKNPFGTNLTIEFDGPPVAFKSLVAACAQMPAIVRSRGEVSEPQWYHSINLVRFVENGRKFAHRLSDQHPDYSVEATDAKLDQLEAKAIKPTSCARMATEFGDAICEGCPFFGKVKSPIVAARYHDTAPEPVVVSKVDTINLTTTIPDPPKPYKRLSNGHIALTTKNKDGDEMTVIIYKNDLYPIRRLSNEHAKLEQQTWRVTLPFRGTKDFMLDADALYDRRKFVTTVSNQGIYPESGNIQNLQDYMIAYISELQRLSDAETQSNHLGWADDYTKFILPDRILGRDGSVKPAMLSSNAATASAHVMRKGTMEEQVRLLKFYDSPTYVAHQFLILCGLAAPLFYATGHHGVIVNATGEPGASKSTALYTAASFWGHPELYTLNGTNRGATANSRIGRVTTIANLPICVDEITHMPEAEAVDLAMGITQPGHRMRLNRDGSEQTAPDSLKATMMLCTANSSLHTMLSANNTAGTAGSMRVFEMFYHKTFAHTKPEADDYLYELKQNFGHIGPVFMTYVMARQDEVAARVRAVMREVDERYNIQPSERYWSASVTVVMVALEIAIKLKVLSFQREHLELWIANVQLPTMRGTIVEQYVSPMGVLANYLEHINGDIIVVTRAANMRNLPNVTRTPRGQMRAHFDTTSKTMWLLKKDFKDYCRTCGADYIKTIDDLHNPRPDAQGNSTPIVANKHIRKVLGAGTEYAKAQSWCFVVNMAHPEVSGSVDLKVILGDKKDLLLTQEV